MARPRFRDWLKGRFGRPAAPPPTDPAAERAARPCTRWWWFSGPIDPADVEAQLDWLASNGFGGVEIAWIYPLQTKVEGPEFLSPEWAEAVKHARQAALARGLACDLTFGSLWPFCGSFVEREDSHHTFDGPSDLTIDGTWEDPFPSGPVRILDHLNREALGRYARVLCYALNRAVRLDGPPPALFCDSWEVPTRFLWSPALGPRFRERFGYDIEPRVDQLDDDPHLNYDYASMISEAVLDEFYRPFAEICRNLNAVSRVQCHGAPTDLLAAYASVDIPESEALLFPPHHSRIAASAAALTGKPLVSCELFTCLYGFPAVHMKEERLDDLKLLADAVLVQGVNQVVWHGTPYQAPGGPTQRFFATTHVGPDSPFAAELPAFNAGLARACAFLRRGIPFSYLAAYLPVEDHRMLGRLPRHLRTPGAVGHWELRDVTIPRELEGYAPLWVTGPFLDSATWEAPFLKLGAAVFQGLSVDVQWLDPAALGSILRLARQGMPLLMTGRTRRPGRGHAEPPEAYEETLDELMALPNVGPEPGTLGLVPLIEGDDLPPFWVRLEGEDLLFFFAHPATRDVKYPIQLGQGAEASGERRRAFIRSMSGRLPVDLDFPAGGSILLRIGPRGELDREVWTLGR